MRLEALPQPPMPIPLGRRLPASSAWADGWALTLRLDWELARLRLGINGALVDRAAIWHYVAPLPHGQLDRQLWNAFETGPLEDGVSHPAEQIIEEFVRSARDAHESLARIVSDETSPAFAATVLRCLSRVAGVGSASWRTDLVRRALGSPDVQIRDAALQAAEEWGEVAMRPVLQSHVGAERVPWLREVARELIEELA